MRSGKRTAVVTGFPGRAVAGQVYVPGIDGLRAIAVLAVMIFHLIPKALPGGFVGVDVFFVISGYVVTGSLLRDSELPFHRFITAFYARRFRRIVPALVVCLCVTVALSVALIPKAWLSESLEITGLRAFVGLSNFALITSDDGYFAPRAEFNPFMHTWSLAVEEQFYVLFPLMLYYWIGRPASPGAGTVRILFAMLCAASLVWCAWATVHAPSHAYYMLSSRFWELGLGATCYLMGDKQRMALKSAVGSSTLVVIGACLVTASLLFAQRTAFPFPWALPAVLGSAMLIVAMSTRGVDSWILRGLSLPPVVAVGLLSYSLYLWHWPVYTLLRWTVGLESL